MNSSAPSRPRVVVVGAGFGGLACVRALRHADADVTLVDRQPYNTFQPLLYLVATASLNPGDVSYFLRSARRKQDNLAFVHATVERIDQDGRAVHLADGRRLEFDHLVVACGVTANFFGTPGADEYAYALYTRPDAIHLRDAIFARLELAARDRARDLRVVVIGGGPTGVETAGALAEMRNKDLPVEYPELSTADVAVTLVELGPTLLAPFTRTSQEYARRSLAKRGVDIRLNTTVREVRPDGVVINDGTFLPAGLVIWAGGVSGHHEVSTWGLPLDRRGRIEVDDHLRVQGRSGVYAVGDASVEAGDRALPQLAQPALQGGKFVGSLITAELIGKGATVKPFRYKDKGILATIGRSSAVAEVKHVPPLRGFLAWSIWIGVHVLTLLDNRNRAATFVNLAARYLTRSGHNAIVGDATPPLPPADSADAPALRAPNTKAPAAQAPAKKAPAKAGAKKTPAKKSPAKKAPPRRRQPRRPAKKSPAKKTPADPSAEATDHRDAG